LRGVTSTFFSSDRVLSKVSKMGALLVVSVVRTSVRKDDSHDGVATLAAIRVPPEDSAQIGQHAELLSGRGAGVHGFPRRRGGDRRRSDPDRDPSQPLHDVARGAWVRDWRYSRQRADSQSPVQLRPAREADRA